ncbi:MAG: hypothetical protein ISR65_04465 [Bacteriovoracaceae bacterium]|nr:hypothetical protein [Bacteriovoracaceae bacterium]
MKNYVSIIKLIVSAVALMISTNALSDIYNYHPESRLYMGGGYNPYHPYNGYLACIDHDGEQAVDTQGAVSSEIFVGLLQSRKDFYNLINFSSSLGGSYLFFNGNASVDLTDERAFHSDSLTWIILFKTDYGRHVLKNPRMKSEFRGLSDNEIYNRCGSEVVTEQRKSVMVYALLTISNLTQSRKRELETKFSASAKGTFWSANLNTHYQSVLKTALMTSDIRVKVRAIGGNGISDLAPIIGGAGNESYVNYKEIPNVLRSYMESMGPATAVPSQYITTNITVFRPDIEERFSDFKKIQIAEFYTRYKNYSSIVSRLDSLLYGADAQNYSLNNDQKDHLMKGYNDYSDAMNKVFNDVKGCFEIENSGCQLPRVSVPVISWPKESTDYSFCEYTRRQALDLGLIEQDMFIMATRRDFYPEIDFADGKPVINGWYPCE